jgi:hypothetical protein
LVNDLDPLVGCPIVLGGEEKSSVLYDPHFLPVTPGSLVSVKTLHSQPGKRLFHCVLLIHDKLFFNREGCRLLWGKFFPFLVFLQELNSRIDSGSILRKVFLVHRGKVIVNEIFLQEQFELVLS